MTKSIKLEDNIHRELDELRTKRETFSDVVTRLIRFYQEITRIVWSRSGEHPGGPGSAA